MATNDIYTLGGGSINFGQNFSDSIGKSTSSSSSGSSGSSASGVEQWYQDYEKALLGMAQRQAEEGYTPYDGQLVAGLNSDQLGAMQMIRDAVANPAYQKYIDQWAPSMAGVPGMMGESADLIRGSSTFDPNAFSSMYATEYAPAIQALQAEASRIGNKDFTDTTLASLNRNFTGSGGWGGSRNQILGADAAARAQAEIEGKKAGFEMQGRTSAAQDYLNWAKQGLAGGQALGSTAQGILSGAKSALDYGITNQGAIGSDATALGNVGNQLQTQEQKGLDSEYAQFLKEQAFPWEQITNFGNMIKSAPAPQWSSGSNSSWGNSSSVSDQASSSNGYNIGLTLPANANITGSQAGNILQGAVGGLGLANNLMTTGNNPANLTPAKVNRDAALYAAMGY